MNRWTTATVRTFDMILAIVMLVCFSYQAKHNPPDSFPVVMSGLLWIYFSVVTVKNFRDHAREIKAANPGPVMKHLYFVSYNFPNGSGRCEVYRDEMVNDLQGVEGMENAVLALGKISGPIVIVNFIYLGYKPYGQVTSS